MKLKSLQRKSLARVPADFTTQQRRFAESVAENLDVLTGRRGNLIDRAVTFRDLLDAGVLRRVSGLVTDGDVIDVTGDDEGDSDLPNRPYNLNASGGFFAITLTWQMARYKGHNYTEIWRAPAPANGSVPNIDDIEKDYGPYDFYYGDINFYVDKNVGSGQTYYYWVRAVNNSGEKSPFNDRAGTGATTAIDYLQVEDWIDEILDTDLGNLGLADHIESVVGVLGSTYSSYNGSAVIDFVNTFTEPNVNATTFAQALLDDVFPDGYSQGGGLVSSIYSNITTTDAQGNVTYVATAGNVSNLMTAVGLSGSTSTKIDALYSALGYDNGTQTFDLTSTVFEELKTEVTTGGSLSSRIDALYTAMGYNSGTDTFALTSSAFSTLSTEVSDLDTEIFAGSTTTSRIDTLFSNLTYTDENGDSTVLDAANVQDLATEVYGSGTGLYGATSSRIDGVEAILTDPSGSLWGATVIQQTVARVGNGGDLYDLNGNLIVASASSVSTLSSSVSTLTSDLSDVEADLATAEGDISTLTSSVQTNISSINGIQGKYSVKIDNNGHISGFGLISKANLEDANNPVTSSFIVAADRFAIAADFNEGSTGNSAVGTNYPFKVFTTSQTSATGGNIPAGVYIRDAFIHEAQITGAMIDQAQINIANITGLLNANRITSGNIQLSNSNNIAIFQGKTAAGTSGSGFWLGNNNGSGQFYIGDANKYFYWDGSEVVTKAIKVVNSAGNTVLAANGDINGAFIQNATITSAKIATANISTLLLAGDAVTIPRGGSGGTQSLSSSANVDLISVPISYSATGTDGNGNTVSTVPTGVIVTAHATVNMGAVQAGPLTLSIYVGGTVIGSVSTTQTGQQVLAVTGVDTPPAGSTGRTYILNIVREGANSGSPSVSSSGMTVIGSKR